MKAFARLLLVALALHQGMASTSGLPDGGRQALAQQPPAEGWSYESWVARRRIRLFEDRFGDEIQRLKATITAVEKEIPPPFSDWHTPTVLRCEVSEQGRIRHHVLTGLGHKGGGSAQLSAEELTRLDHLLSQLPDDGRRLPPPDRRLTLQVLDGEETITRVYDRANPPAELLEILRLCPSSIRPWALEFEPEIQWKAHESSRDGGVDAVPGKNLIVSTSERGPLKLWDLQGGQIKEIPLRKDSKASSLTLAPGGSVAAIDSSSAVYLLNPNHWRAYRRLAKFNLEKGQSLYSPPRFSADGAWLFIESRRPPLSVVKTATGERCDVPDYVPQDAVAYVPAPKSRRAIYLSENGDIRLWDAQQRRDVALLDTEARFNHVAFSPDDSQVAIATVHRAANRYWSVHRLRIWNANNGALIRPLRPFEQETCRAVTGLRWTPEGQFVLAAVCSHRYPSGELGIWKASSGRQRGNFAGCGGEVTGLALLDDGRLVAGNVHGMIGIWDLPAAIKQIGDLEQSLSRSETTKSSGQ